MPAISSRLNKYLFPALAFVLPFSLYFATAARDIFWLDSAEFVVITAVNGLVHPPGYPLLLILTQLIAGIPLFSLPFRLNLLAAFFAALSCLVLFVFLFRITKERFVSLLGTLVWAICWELWQQATAIEVYGLEVLLLGLALLIADSYARTGSVRLLLLLAFVLSLNLAHHLFFIFWLPAIILIIYPGMRQPLNKQSILLLLLLLLAGPLLYLTLLLRNQNAPSWAGITGLSELFDYITARIYRYRLFAGKGGYIATQFAELPKILFQQFTIFWLLLIPGIVNLLKTERRLLFGLLTGILISAPAALLYNIPDKEGYFLPVYFGFAIIIGAGIYYLWRRHRVITGVSLGLFLILALFSSYPKQNRSRLSAVADLGKAVISELPDGAILFTDDYSLLHAINYLNLGPDSSRRITVISQYHLSFPWYLKQLSRQLPVPAAAFSFAEELWRQPVKPSDAQFGELARSRAEQIMEILITGLLPRPIYYFPQNFTTLLENWHTYHLKLHGLTYEFRPSADTLLDFSFDLKFPGPERYCATRFYDSYTVDLCRRFAATVNRRGMLKFAKDDVAGAMQDFNLSLKYFPDYPAAIENKGLVFALKNVPDSARFYLNRFLILDPQSPETEKVRFYLNRLGP